MLSGYISVNNSGIILIGVFVMWMERVRVSLEVKLMVDKVRVSSFHVYLLYEKWLKIWLIKLDQNIIKENVMFIYMYGSSVIFIPYVPVY